MDSRGQGVEGSDQASWASQKIDPELKVKPIEVEL